MASHLVGSLITCSEGCVGPGLSLAWTAWLRLRCNTLPMKEVGELTVCVAVIPVKTIGTWLNLAFSLAWQRIFPRVQSLSPERPFRVNSLRIFIAAR